jgi:RNA polymerase sigma factor (sigma-70 family)
MPSPSFTLLRTQSDDRLVALARSGHERAFEAIVERYRRPLLRVARRVLPEARAEDALQQALIAAWTALQRGDEVRDLRPWLFRAVHNTALNALRVSGYDYDQLEDELRLADTGAGDEELERRAVVRQTLASLAALPERQREALLRTAVSGHSQEEVARDLGISDNAMRQLIHRARVSVRAAATALTPLPLVTAAASGSGARGGALVDRIAELAAGAAPAGASVTAAKAGVAVVLAGGALSGPALVDHVADRPQREATAAAATVAPAARRHRPAVKGGGARSTPAARVAAPARSVARPAPSRRVVRRQRLEPPRAGEREGGSRERHSGSGEEHASDDDVRAPSSGSGSGERDHSGSDDSGSGASGSGETSEDDGPDSSRPAEALAVAAPSATPVAPELDSHGSDSGSDDELDAE